MFGTTNTNGEYAGCIRVNNIGVPVSRVEEGVVDPKRVDPPVGVLAGQPPRNRACAVPGVWACERQPCQPYRRSALVRHSLIALPHAWVGLADTGLFRTTGPIDYAAAATTQGTTQVSPASTGQPPQNPPKKKAEYGLQKETAHNHNPIRGAHGLNLAERYATGTDTGATGRQWRVRTRSPRSV